MKYSQPIISEVNIELKDFDFHIGTAFNEKNLTFGFNFEVDFESPNFIIFFIHVEYFYSTSKKVEKTSLFHTDYYAQVEVFSEKWGRKKSILVNQNDLAHLVGVSVTMVRGAISSRLRGNTLEDNTFPIINPLQKLSEKLEKSKDNFVIYKYTANKPKKKSN